MIVKIGDKEINVPYGVTVSIIDQPEEENNYIDREGFPYDSEGEHCWPAGGGLDKRCDYNADALYAYYVAKSSTAIWDYLNARGFEFLGDNGDAEWWCKGNTFVYFEGYSGGCRNGMYGYMHTELLED